MRLRLMKNGYVQAALHRGGASEYRYVQDLVLTTFVEPRPSPEHEARHYYDNDRTNNRLSNLRWGTNSENKLDTVRHGTHRNSKKSECVRGHSLERRNLIPSALARGERKCLACNRAHAEITRHPDLNLRQRADAHYKLIMETSEI